ncbi:MAG: acid phosphatase [Sphingomonas sp. SCN 67-18]|uniref:5'-nucleotidase, lipoprotein e(P4) family n=1 Tax=uncultured Sphingomonas sp. TaxID=158754 RepID=UPI00086E795F|nr:HAD family acid phosphatase [Sphingomonas sp. SCN 67-18]ODU20795.1 MAG: acid phosphatase [Sphingomonas sp. SCN 67-18]
MSAVRAALLTPVLALAACATTGAPEAAPAPPAAPPGATQFLYGSAESAALSIQAYQGLVDHVLRDRAGNPQESVVLAPGATLAAPSFGLCGDRKPAVVLDADETVILNVGYQYYDALKGHSFDMGRWERWEQTGATAISPVPGAVAALTALRKAGVTVIFNTNRSAANAAWTADALNRAGVGPAVHGETLFLAGDDAMGTRKDGRRATIAAKYCVIALVGDQLGDFSDLFAAIPSVADRRAAAVSGPIARMWGNGWFVLPNPVYGSGLKGGFDEIFPADKRWTDPADEGAN